MVTRFETNEWYRTEKTRFGTKNVFFSIHATMNLCTVVTKNDNNCIVSLDWNDIVMAFFEMLRRCYYYHMNKYKYKYK